MLTDRPPVVSKYVGDIPAAFNADYHKLNKIANDQVKIAWTCAARLLPYLKIS